MTIKASGRLLWCSLGAALFVSAGLVLPAAQATNTVGGGSGQLFVPIVPCRLLDTRGASHIGPRSSPLGPGDTYNQAVTGANGQCTIPAQAAAVALNVTTVNGTADSYLTLWPADASQPLASNLNWKANDGATPNKVDVKLGADGRINLYNFAGNVDVIADVVGYYADHNHDDRYYSKAEVDAAVQAAITEARRQVHHDVYSPLSVITFLGGSTTATANCIQATGVPVVPLTVPLGAKLISIEVDVLDGAGTNSYSFRLQKYTADATGETLSTIALQTGGTGASSPARIHHVLVPATAEVIDAGESLNLELSVSSGNAFCGAIFNYETG